MVALLARAPDLAVGELHDLARLEAVHDLALGGRRAALAVDGGELVRVAGKVACRRCWRGCPVQTKRVDWLIAFG